eukprot:TRINITY_DN6042_c0_g1_i3.p1 TRINITY_DN6042_c0_g1~~TRINITY_DN6042_c0_g1_i3.p1  ORF type:complete len:392 (-),score=80.64 TRINITY_DN6042_c0_g1_i3:112-1287(-)
MRCVNCFVFGSLLTLALFAASLNFQKFDTTLTHITFEGESPSKTLDVLFHPNPREDKFLVYSTHSGFSNQLLGLYGAAVLARIAGRVLVIPPILYHGQLSFGGVSHCNSQNEKLVIDGSTFIYQNNLGIGHFADIFEFDAREVYAKSGLKLISWEEFVKLGFKVNGPNWNVSYSTLGCQKKPSYAEVVAELRRYDAKVLQIGSAFSARVHVLLKQEKNSTRRAELKDILDYFGSQAPLRKEIAELADRLVNSSFFAPTEITAVHIRSGDKGENAYFMINKTEAYLKQTRLELPDSRPFEVFLASDIKHGTRNPILGNLLSQCDKVLDLSNLEELEGNDIVVSTSRNLGIDVALLRIVLDQNICARAKRFYGGSQGSTFQIVIKKRRELLVN